MRGREAPREFYERTYEQTYDDLRYDAVYEAAASLLREAGVRAVLDVGCGTGRLGRFVRPHGIAYRGVDFSERAIAQGRRRYPELADALSVGDVYDPAVYAGADAFVAIESLEHVDDRRVLSLLPTGSLLVASAPNFWAPGHVRRFRTGGAVRRHYAEAIAVDRIEKLGPFPGSTWWARIWVFRGRVR